MSCSVAGTADVDVPVWFVFNSRTGQGVKISVEQAKKVMSKDLSFRDCH